jgi:hypothetical protein
MEDTDNKEQVRLVRKFTLDGEILVQRTPMGDFEAPLVVEELKPLPPKMKEVHICELKLFHSLLLTIRKNRPKRTYPVTRTEFLRAGADPQIVRKLCEFGILVQETLQFLVDGKTNTGSRSCLYYTPQGRALIRARLDPSYGLPEGTNGR